MNNIIPEYWATFSIYDFRTPRLRQALVLFDKIVVPIPDAPIKGKRGEITAEDIDRLSVEVDYLKEHGIAMPVVWNKAEFDAWRELKSAESTALALGHAEIDTRAQLMESVKKSLEEIKKPLNEYPTVLPVYSDFHEYNECYQAMHAGEVDGQVLQIVAKALPMPADDEDLQRIVDLRHRESFRVFMPAFREWQQKVAAKLYEAGGDKVKREREIRIATLELQNSIRKFEIAVQEAHRHKLVKGVTLPLVVGSTFMGEVRPLLAAILHEGPELLHLHELVQPWWRPLLKEEFALAGIICQAAKR
jgi:hypothetical protein